MRSFFLVVIRFQPHPMLICISHYPPILRVFVGGNMTLNVGIYMYGLTVLTAPERHRSDMASSYV